MTPEQSDALRALIFELADKHNDRPRFERALAQVELKHALLATALCATFADGWPPRTAFNHFHALGIPKNQIESALHSMLEFPDQLLRWHSHWSDQRN